MSSVSPVVEYAAGLVATGVFYSPQLVLAGVGVRLNPDSAGRFWRDFGGVTAVWLLWCAAWKFTGAMGIPNGLLLGTAISGVFLGLCIRHRSLVHRQLKINERYQMPPTS